MENFKDNMLNRRLAGTIDVYYADNISVPDSYDEFMEFSQNRLSRYLGPKHLALMNSYKTYTKKNLEGIAALYAHGGMYRRKWVYDDGNSLHSVKDWVEGHDGNYNLLMLFCHNPNDIKLESKKSVLLFPDNGFNKPVLCDTQTKLFFPSIGFVNSNNIDLLIKDLEEKTQKP